MISHTLDLLTPEQAPAKRAGLVDLLVDSVESGASVNFVWPMTRSKAETWWESALASHARGERLIFTAEAGGRLDGTVQLILAPQENQAFRADIAKCWCIGAPAVRGSAPPLMRAAEEAARRIGRTLLTLDTETGSDGERLYERLGWIRFGQVPGYATTADNRTRQTVSFFYKAL